ncbi:MAG: hypothetical protein ACXIT9_07445 [Nitritalea sp.]
MKTADTILLSLTAACFIIAAHQTLVAGIMVSYPYFMLVAAMLFWYQFRRKKREEAEKSAENQKQERSKPKKKPRR